MGNSSRPNKTLSDLFQLALVCVFKVHQATWLIKFNDNGPQNEVIFHHE